METIDKKVFCNELINFKKTKDPSSFIDLCVAKSLKLKDIKKIPKKFKFSEYKNKADFFKALAPNTFVYHNLLSIRDCGSGQWATNHLDCGLLSFGYSSGITKDIRILFIEEDFLGYESEIFIPILEIENNNNLKEISKEIMDYYNKFNRFGVKLPVPKYSDYDDEFLEDDIFSKIQIFINEETQNFIDMNTLEEQFKLGFSKKIENVLLKFRNYFDPKYKLVPNGDFDIYFYLVDFKKFPIVGSYCNPKNAHRSITFEDEKKK